MTMLSHDCPHCRVKNNGFTVHGTSANSQKERGIWHTTFLCNSCFNPVVVTTSGDGITNPAQQPGDISKTFKVLAIYPKPEKIDIPEHLPVEISEAFSDGCQIMNIGEIKSGNSAIQTFRRCLELALKDKSPEIDAWKLEKRIDAMSKQGLITKDIADWAHDLRLDGNEASHEGGISREDAAQVMELTRMVLLYIFTIPEQIKIKRGVMSAD
jgi:Domain of unknown function (DUF4145)